MKILSDINHLTLLAAGVAFGFIPTAIAGTISLYVRFSLLGLGLGFLLIAIIIVIALVLLSTSNPEEPNTRKARYVFFGISLISFVLAFFDLFVFLVTPVSFAFLNSTHDFLIGGVSIRDFFTDFAVGGLFSVLERYFELREKEGLH
jgi:hypothetical protein